MNDALIRNVIRKLKKEKILAKNDKLSFEIKGTVPFSSYNNDLYEFDNNLKANFVDIYWAPVKKRREYSEVYLTILSEYIAYITVISQEKIKFSMTKLYFRELNSKKDGAILAVFKRTFPFWMVKRIKQGARNLLSKRIAIFVNVP